MRSPSHTARDRRAWQPWVVLCTLGSLVRGPDSIALASTVGRHLSRHRRRGATEGSSDRSQGESVMKTEEDLFTLMHAEPARRRRPQVASSGALLTAQHPANSWPGETHLLSNCRLGRGRVCEVEEPVARCSLVKCGAIWISWVDGHEQNGSPGVALTG